MAGKEVCRSCIKIAGGVGALGVFAGGKQTLQQCLIKDHSGGKRILQQCLIKDHSCANRAPSMRNYGLLMNYELEMMFALCIIMH
jgi:hypothetical protein